MTTGDDIPISVTQVVYTVDPTRATHGVSQNNLAEWFAPYWDAIEAHFRRKIAQEILTDETETPWGFPHLMRKGDNDSWIDTRDASKAAHIANKGEAL